MKKLESSKLMKLKKKFVASFLFKPYQYIIIIKNKFSF